MGFFDFLKGKSSQENWKKTLVKDLAMLTAIDGEMDKDEIKELLNIAVNQLSFSESEFIKLLNNLGNVEDIYPTTPDEKLEYMLCLIRMTYSDGYVDDNEITYMEIVASKMGLPKDGVQKAMKIIENEVFRNTKAKKSNQMSLEERLSNILLSNKMQANMYNQVRELKYYTDQLMMNQSAESINKYRNVILQSIDSAVEVYELLKGRGILELNAIVILASFYLVNLSDITLKNPHKFTDLEISNTLNTFLAAMGASEHVNGSSYNGLVRISINWLLSHQTN
jgi:hypothetical protein